MPDQPERRYWWATQTRNFDAAMSQSTLWSRRAEGVCCWPHDSGRLLTVHQRMDFAGAAMLVCAPGCDALFE